MALSASQLGEARALWEVGSTKAASSSKGIYTGPAPPCPVSKASAKEGILII